MDFNSIVEKAAANAAERNARTTAELNAQFARKYKHSVGKGNAPKTAYRRLL